MGSRRHLRRIQRRICTLRCTAIIISVHFFLFRMSFIEIINFQLGGDTKGQFLTSSSRSMDPCITKISDTSFMLGRHQSSIIVDELSPDTPSESIMKIKEPIIARGIILIYIKGGYCWPVVPVVADQYNIFYIH